MYALDTAAGVVAVTLAAPAEEEGRGQGEDGRQEAPLIRGQLVESSSGRWRGVLSKKTRMMGARNPGGPESAMNLDDVAIRC